MSIHPKCIQFSPTICSVSGGSDCVPFLIYKIKKIKTGHDPIHPIHMMYIARTLRGEGSYMTNRVSQNQRNYIPGGAYFCRSCPQPYVDRREATGEGHYITNRISQNQRNYIPGGYFCRSCPHPYVDRREARGYVLLFPTCCVQFFFTILTAQNNCCLSVGKSHSIP